MKLTTSTRSTQTQEFLSKPKERNCRYLPQFLFGLAAPVTLFFVLMRVCLPAASVLLICTILYLLVLALLWIVLKRRRRRPARPVPAFADRFREMLAGMDTLKMYQADAVF